MINMATGSPHADPTSEKCGMCFDFWTTKRQIRKLPCSHCCCMDCLAENQTLNHRTVCPICRVDHGELNFQALEVAYEGKTSSSENLTCGVQKCTTKSVCYCSDCKRLFCKRHQETHDEVLDHEIVSLANYQQQKEEITVELCGIHPAHPVVLSCERCLILKCELCEEKDDCANAEGKHSLRTIKRVAEGLSPVIREKLKKFSTKRAAVEKKLKQILMESDDLNEETRLMLERIDEAVGQLKEQIDREAAQLKQRVLDHNTEVSGQAEELTRSINAFLDEGSDWTSSAKQFMRKSSSAQVRLHAELDGRGERLLAEEFPEFKPTQRRLADRELKVELPLELTDKELKVELPLKLVSAQPRLPTSLKLKNKITTPKCCNTVTHHQGRIIHGGYRYPLTGLDFNPQLGGGCVHSLCKHNNFLYVLQHENSYKSVHIVNLSTQAVRKAVIRYQSSSWINHLTVNNVQIIITDHNSKSVKIYSTSNFTHQFDIKSEHLSGYPCGITEIPNGSIVVSDYNNGLVCNLTLERNPTIKWVRKDLKDPTGITLDSDSQFLLVASQNGRKIYVMSLSGEVIRELSPPGLLTGLLDISVSGSELVVASSANAYQVYEMEY